MTKSSPQLRPNLNRLHFLNSLLDLLIIICACLSAFLLRFEFALPNLYKRDLAIALVVWIPVKLLAFHIHGLHRNWGRLFSITDAVQLVVANLEASIAGVLLILAVAPPGFPRSIPILDFLLCSIGTASVSLAGRAIREAANSSQLNTGRRAIIYGAGAAGVKLYRELRGNPGLGYNIAGFVDDNRAMARMYVHGVPVLGRGADLAALAARTAATEVLIAIPSASGEQMIQILNFCQQAGVQFRTVCRLGEMIERKGTRFSTPRGRCAGPALPHPRGSGSPGDPAENRE
jgi:FlaA1/EpsC-like NDP-sugar epimerase